MSRKLKQFKKAYKGLKWLVNHLHLRKLEIVVLAVILVEFLFPQVSLAQGVAEPSYQVETIMVEEQFLNNDPDNTGDFTNSLPSADIKEPQQVIWITVTAYSSTADQTDASPCVTANGFNVCENNVENVVAANFLPFGTVVKMPDYAGDRVFTVQDRMNARYTYRLDIWMKSRAAAKEFGVKRLKVEIY